MIIIRHKIDSYDAGRQQVALVADRHALQKTRWRGVAEDGMEFGFDLDAPLRHGDFFFETDRAVYVARQRPEPVLVIDNETPWRRAAEVAWAAGNLHQPVEFRADGMRLPDEPAVRALLEQSGLDYGRSEAVFQPQGGGHHHSHHKEHHAHH
jgi:urease accessory protein